MKNKVTIELKNDEVNLILTALGNQPYFQVYLLINKIQQQVGPQLLENYQNGQDAESQGIFSEMKKNE
jgi:hypothetical protein